MVVSTVTHGTTRSSDSQTAAVELVTRSVTEFGCLVHKLVEGRENVVCKLNLSNRSLSH